MSDRYFAISNFKWGLETRKSELLIQPGAVTFLVDGFINQGGEIEQRKSFARDYSANFPSYTFGIQDTDVGIITFGDVAQPHVFHINALIRTANVANIQTTVNHDIPIGATITVSGATGDASFNVASAVVTNVTANSLFYANPGPNTGIIVEATGVVFEPFPSGINYQQLTYPFVTTNPPRLTGIPFSVNRNGKAFVISKWSDGNRFLYYDSVLVPDSRNGLVLQSNGLPETISDLATDLANQVSGLGGGWTGLANKTATIPGGSPTNRAGGVLFEGPPSVVFTPKVSEVSTLGLLGAIFNDQDNPGSPGAASTVAFTLNAGTTGTVTVTAPKNADGSGTASLTGGAINFNTTLSQTAADVALAINVFSSITGYIATSTGAKVTIAAPPTFGPVVFNVTVVTTGDITSIIGAAVAGAYGISLSATTSTGFIVTGPYGNGWVVNRQTARGASAALSINIVATSFSGGGTTTFVWSAVNADGTPLATPVMNMSSLTGASLTLTKVLTSGTQLLGYFKVIATDSGGATGSPYTLRFTVVFTAYA